MTALCHYVDPTGLLCSKSEGHLDHVTEHPGAHPFQPAPADCVCLHHGRVGRIHNSNCPVHDPPAPAKATGDVDAVNPFAPGGSRFGEVCQHGTLTRKCYTCELEAENATLRTALADIRREAQNSTDGNGPMLAIESMCNEALAAAKDAT